jgi:pyrimidine operon attenuation protein/uracil phosphoribosyltransferase
VGLKKPVAQDERVDVLVKELDGRDAVELARTA